MKVNKIEPMKGISVFSTALCNLKCSYCYICKNGKALKPIDDAIAKDHAEGNYIKQLLQFSEEDRNSITKLDIWGGEPLLHLDRVTDNIEGYFDVLPNLEKVFFSTNFTVEGSIDKIKRLISKLEHEARKKSKKLALEIQISIDGYEKINDMNRGKGTTQKILKHFKDLLDVKYDTDLIHIKVFTKPTLSTDSFKYFQTKEDAIKYYAFFEDEFYQKWKASGSNIQFLISIPNYAEPFEYTKEDGIKFAKICRIIQEVSRENHFEGYKGYSLVPYAMVLSYSLKDEWLDLNKMDRLGYMCGGGCGHIRTACTLTPGNRVSACHRGFFDDFNEYAEIHTKEYNDAYAKNMAQITANNRWNYTMDEFEKARESMNLIYNHPNKTKTLQTKKILQLYAYAGLIDEKYKEERYANQAAQIYSMKSMCVQNNIEVTGSMFVDQLAMVKLLFNGAFDVIVEELEHCKRGVKE